MWHAKSANGGGVTVPKFDLPETKAQFDKLTVQQKSVLLEQYPERYHRFMRPKRPWEGEKE